MSGPTFGRDELLTLVRHAVAAPSADNLHHLSFVARPDGLDVHVDEFFARLPTGHRRLLTLLSYGAVAENLRLTLLSLGWSYEPAWVPAPTRPELLLSIEAGALKPASGRDALVDFIGTRHTNRRLYGGALLSAAERESLEAAARSVAGVDLEWYDTPSRRRAVTRLMRTAEAARFRSEEHHRELFESIAFADGWKAASPVHIAPGSLEIERPMRGAFRRLASWPLMRALGGIGVHWTIALRAVDLPVRSTAHVLGIGSHAPGDAAALSAGAAMQRIWLAAEGLGLAIQPMAASAVLAEDRTDEGRLSGLAESLRVGWARIDPTHRPLIVLRIGRAPRPEVRSGRPDPESFVGDLPQPAEDDRSTR